MDAVEELLGAIVDWAHEQPDVKAILLLGSQARQDVPADRFSDIDLTITVDEPGRYLDRVDWLQRFGAVAYTFVQQAAPGPHRERRVAFSNGQLVDFAFRSTAESQGDIREGLPAPRAAVVGRGYRLLVDKIGIRSAIEAASRRRQTSLPSESEFAEAVNQFWLLCLVATNKLERGELWVAARYLNCSLAAVLERVLAWHADLVAEGRPSWHSGRFLESWAAPSFRKALDQVLAPANANAIRRSLQAMAESFDLASSEVARSQGFRFPVVDSTLARDRLWADR
jgi:aminoglycoside 6-adenylyltransferase